MLNIGLDGGLSVLGLGVVAWLASKIVDRGLDWAFGKKIIEPCINEIQWRVRAFKTRGDPLKITYEIKYSPRSNYSVQETKNLVSEGLKSAGEHSKGRAEIDMLSWDEQKGENGFVEIDYIESDYPFEMEVSLIEDPDDLRERPSVPFEERVIESIHFSIDFSFAFANLEETLQNLGAFASFLQKGMEEQVDGTFSQGQFVIYPVESDLTLDEWIKNEGFDVSLLLANTEEMTQKTEVEFFSDRAEIHPPHLEIDSETTRHIRLLILNYYLQKE